MGQCLIAKRSSGELGYEIIKSWETDVTSVEFTASKKYKGLFAQVAQTGANSGSSPSWRDMTIDGVKPTQNYFFMQSWRYNSSLSQGSGSASYLYIGIINEGSIVAMTSHGTRANQGRVIGLL